VREVVAQFGDIQALYTERVLSRPSGKYLYVNPDYEQVWTYDDGSTITKVSRNTRNGIAYGAVSGKAVPATARFIDDRTVNFTCDLQYWLHDLGCERIPNRTEAEKKAWFRSCYRDNVWATNFAGTVTRQDCINNTNVGAGFPQIQPMATGGTVLRYVGETRITGTDCYLIEAINPLNYRSYHPSTHRWLFFEPTLSARYWVEYEPGNDGHPDRTTKKQEWYQEPMHFYAENTVMAVFGFIPDSRSSTGWVNAVPKVRCRFLGENEAVPNPFIMRFGRKRARPYQGF
jgi:hypothetical protein